MSSIDTVKSQLHPWTSPYGEVRYYIEDWYPLVADVLDKYVRDEWMSPDLKKIQRAKVWFDTSAHIHVDGLKDDMVIEIIKANIENRHFLRSSFVLLLDVYLIHIGNVGHCDYDGVRCSFDYIRSEA